MRIPKPFPGINIENLREKLKKSETKLEYQRVQCIWLRARFQMFSYDIAEAIGWNETTVRKLHGKFLKTGEKVFKKEARGGRYRSNLSLQEEKEFLAGFLEKSKKGEILVVNEVKLAYEKRIGHKVPKSTIYRILSRHGWRKISPRQQHPKGDELKQDEFKKNLKT
jgi:transposase